VHPEPVRRDRANFIVRARLPEPGRAEQLWGRQLDERSFELCCIPFFLYDVALGDIVATDAAYEVQQVVEPRAGHTKHPRQYLTWGEALMWRSSAGTCSRRGQRGGPSFASGLPPALHALPGSVPRGTVTPSASERSSRCSDLPALQYIQISALCSFALRLFRRRLAGFRPHFDLS
jgi:hypothetical protein